MTPQIRLSVSLAAIAAAACLTAAASAQTTSEPLDDLLACRQLADPAERLACFDTAAASVALARDSGDLVAIRQSDFDAVERESFGLNLTGLARLGGNLFRSRDSSAPRGPDAVAEDGVRVLERSSDGGIDRASLLVERYTTFDRGKLRFYMQNGQVWEQTDTRPIRPPRGGEPFEVEIRSGALGSFLLNIPGVSRSIGVRRTR